MLGGWVCNTSPAPPDGSPAGAWHVDVSKLTVLYKSQAWVPRPYWQPTSQPTLGGLSRSWWKSFSRGSMPRRTLPLTACHLSSP